MEAQKKFLRKNLGLFLLVYFSISDYYASDANTLISMEEISQAIQKRYASTSSTDYTRIFDTLKQENSRYARLPNSKGISYFRIVSGFLYHAIDAMFNNLTYDSAPNIHYLSDTTTTTNVFKAIFENTDNLSQILSSFLDNGAQIHDAAHKSALDRIRAMPGKMMKIEKEIQQINNYQEGNGTSYQIYISRRFKWFEAAIPSTARERLKKDLVQLKEKMETIHQLQVSQQQTLKEDDKKADPKVIDIQIKK